MIVIDFCVMFLVNDVGVFNDMKGMGGQIKQIDIIKFIGGYFFLNFQVFGKKKK